MKTKIIILAVLLLTAFSSFGLTGVGTDNNGVMFLLYNRTLFPVFTWSAANNPDFGEGVNMVVTNGLASVKYYFYSTTNSAGVLTTNNPSPLVWTVGVGTNTSGISGGGGGITNLALMSGTLPSYTNLPPGTLTNGSLYDVAGAGTAAAAAATNSYPWGAYYLKLANIPTTSAAYQPSNTFIVSTTNTSGILTPVLTNIVVVSANNMTNAVVFTNGTATVYVGITNTPALTAANTFSGLNIFSNTVTTFENLNSSQTNVQIYPSGIQLNGSTAGNPFSIVITNATGAGAFIQMWQGAVCQATLGASLFLGNPAKVAWSGQQPSIGQTTTESYISRLSAGSLQVTTNLSLVGALMIQPVAVFPSGIISITNGLSAYWNSNGFTFHRSSVVGQNTFTDTLQP